MPPRGPPEPIFSIFQVLKANNARVDQHLLADAKLESLAIAASSAKLTRKFLPTISTAPSIVSSTGSVLLPRRGSTRWVLWQLLAGGPSHIASSRF
ncbi:hypothetical protein N7465_002503 [Penicillium sp. CMV-2018d]|nr:hypothetical protein N7465_002503 [Penicillium sp. CMV-2018d]